MGLGESVGPGQCSVEGVDSVLFNSLNSSVVERRTWAVYIEGRPGQQSR